MKKAIRIKKVEGSFKMKENDRGVQSIQDYHA